MYFFLHQDYDDQGTPRGYTQVLWAQIGQTYYAMGSEGWHESNEVPSGVIPQSLSEAEAVLTMMKSARVTAPWVVLFPVVEGKQAP